MQYFKTLIANMAAARSEKGGFTMIELLIVITILGILATAVLSAINPIEQINRGRDTGSQSDAEQLISAIDRYYAFNGTYPWQGTETGAAALDASMHSGNQPVQVTDTLQSPTYPGTTPILSELLIKNELKSSFITRVSDATNPLFIYNQGTGGSDSTYVCFDPQSDAFREQAKARCGNAAGDGLPADLNTSAKSFICQGYDSDALPLFHCLP